MKLVPAGPKRADAQREMRRQNGQRDTKFLFSSGRDDFFLSESFCKTAATALIPAYPAINQLGLFAVFSLDAWSSRKTKHSLTYRTLLVRVTDSAFHLNSSKLPPAGRRSRHKLTAKSASDGAKAERKYISVVVNLKSVQSGACTCENSNEKSPHPVSLAPVYIRLTATSQLTSIHSLTPQHVSSIDTAALCAAAVLTARLVSPLI